MRLVDNFKQFARENPTQIWSSIFLGGLISGHIVFWLLVFITYYAYMDSKNVAFDSPMLDHPDNIITITPLEKGF